VELYINQALIDCRVTGAPRKETRGGRRYMPYVFTEQENGMGRKIWEMSLDFSRFLNGMKITPFSHLYTTEKTN